MKKIILSAIVALTLASGVAMGATDIDYQGGAVSGVAGGSSATSGGVGATGGSAFQGSQAISTNSTGASATEVYGPGTVDVTASTVSGGTTQQESVSNSTGTASGSTGALTAQVGTADASADGAVANGAVDADVDSFGAIGGVGGASVASTATQGSGALTATVGKGSATYGTASIAGNQNGAGVSIQPTSNAATGTTNMNMDTYAVSTGGNLQAVSGTQTGSAFGLAGAGGEQESNSQAGAIGGMLFGQAGAGEIVLGAGLAGNASQAEQGSGGLVFGVNNGDAISTSATFAGNSSGSVLGSQTTADNSLTTVNTGGYEIGNSISGTFNANTPGDAFAVGGGLANESGIGGSAGGFTTLP